MRKDIQKDSLTELRKVKNWKNQKRDFEGVCFWWTPFLVVRML